MGKYNIKIVFFFQAFFHHIHYHDNNVAVMVLNPAVIKQRNKVGIFIWESGDVYANPVKLGARFLG